METHTTTEKRFEFGDNWSEYLKLLDDQKIEEATKSLIEMLEVSTLAGVRFLDIGSGSGLFSLAAKKLGAEVVSFDFDQKSVWCTQQLKEKYFLNDDRWQILSGSVLDQNFIASLGEFGVVYSWGVLHHTGAMWRALANASSAVAQDGKLFVAIYNEQGWRSKIWWIVKWIYNSLHPSVRALYLAVMFVAVYTLSFIAATLKGEPLAPVRKWRSYVQQRGMNPWRDWVDWIGGFPFEVASVKQLVDFYKARDFSLIKVKETKGLGCNQLVFRNK